MKKTIGLIIKIHVIKFVLQNTNYVQFPTLTRPQIKHIILNVISMLNFAIFTEQNVSF